MYNVLIKLITDIFHTVYQPSLSFYNKTVHLPPLTYLPAEYGCRHQKVLFQTQVSMQDKA